MEFILQTGTVKKIMCSHPQGLVDENMIIWLIDTTEEDVPTTKITVETTEGMQKKGHATSIAEGRVMDRFEDGDTHVYACVTSEDEALILITSEKREGGTYKMLVCEYA